jgi:hypothetical protein
MKNLKTFESFQSDRILDKISKHGITSLSDLEKSYLDAYAQNKPEAQNLENELDNKSKQIDSILEYDPRKDDELDLDFSGWSEDDIEDGKFDIIWDQISDKDIENFIITYKLDKASLSKDNNYLSWDNLPTNIKEKFVDFIQSH